ncbi:YwpF family protein [Peribacillus deserti]|nr:YwpF family protein [Peribacillus deserti]
MKTFRLMTLQFVTKEQKLISVNLEDGLIINKEDEQSRWLIEAFISKESFASIEKEVNADGKIFVMAVISKKGNDPVLFETSVCSAAEVDGAIILLLEGVIKKGRNKYAELLLEDLINQGLQGDQLLDAFKLRIHAKPVIAALRD